MISTLKRGVVVLSVVAIAGCSSKPEQTSASAPAPEAARKYLLDRVDDAAIAQIYADGFNSQPLKNKVLMWHLYQAAIAGRDIYFDQQSASGLDMRDVLEAIVTHAGGVKPAVLAEIQRYTKLFWINSGPYNNLTARKFVLTCTPADFAEAAKSAAAAGATFPTASGESLDQLLARLQPMFFDANVAPIVTAKTPPAGQDILQASSNNLYAGVTLKDLAGFKELYGLNSRLVHR